MQISQSILTPVSTEQILVTPPSEAAPVDCSIVKNEKIKNRKPRVLEIVQSAMSLVNPSLINKDLKEDLNLITPLDTAFCPKEC